MQQIRGQIVALLLQAVPTVLIVFLFYLILRSVFFGPLLRVMKERDLRTRGARKEAEEAQAAAAEKNRQYQEAMRQARTQLYAEQDAARRKLLEERAAQVKEARARAAEEVRVAKERVAKEMASARRDIETASVQLAAEIARRFSAAPPGPSRGAR